MRVFLSFCLALVCQALHGQIVYEWSDFEHSGRFWFLDDMSSPWVYTYPANIAHTDAWQSVDELQALIVDAPVVSRSVNLPTGGASSPTYTSTNSYVARLTPGGGFIDFIFTNLPPSTLELRVIGCSTNAVEPFTAHGGWVTTNAPNTASVRRPLVFKWEWREAGVQTNTHRVFAFYDTDNLWRMANLAFSALRYPGTSNVVTARLSVDSSSLVSADVWMFWLYAQSDFANTNRYKTSPTTYTASDYQFRTNYAATTSDAPYANWRSGTPSIPTVSDTTVSNAFWSLWPGLNTQSQENLLFMVSSNWVGYPVESSFPSAIERWYEPFAMTNNTFGQSFDRVSYQSGTTPPSWIWDSAHTNWLGGWGMFITEHHDLRSPVIRHLYPLINSDTSNGTGDVAPGLRWHYFTDQTNAAHLAVAALANLAVVYPSISFENNATEIFDNESVHAGHRYSSQTPRRAGKWVYSGWSGGQADALATTIDLLWPYIATNTVLATNLTAFIPYLSNDTNLVQRHFERFILDGLARDYNESTARGNPWTIGLVMQSGPVSSNFINAAVTPVDVVPNGTGGFKHQYASSFSKAGTHFIGSLFYASDTTMPDIYQTCILYAAGGQQAAYDYSDLFTYPKVLAFAEWQAALSTASGFMPARGDASGGISATRGRFGVLDYPKLWRILNAGGSTERNRMAKYVTDVYGRGTLNDSEWATVQAQSATASYHIDYPDESRVLGGLALLERGLDTTNHANRGSAVVTTGVGYGHDHSDHLDLNIFMHGARLLTDFAARHEGSLVMFPQGYSPQVHNVVEVGGYGHPDNSQTEGHNSCNFLFSTGGVAQVVGSWAWSDGSPAYNHFSRVVSLVGVDETNSYTVSIQRIDAGTWDVSFGAGSTAGGPTNLFTSSLAFTNLLSADVVDDTTFRPAYKLRKHGWQGAYWPGRSATAPGSAEWFKWRLSTATGSASITNHDGNGGTVSWADAAANMGAYEDTYLKLHLFDRTNDAVCFGDAFSSAYGYTSRRIYSMPSRSSISGQDNASQTYLELWEPFVGSAYVTNAASVAVAGTTTNYTGQKALRVQGAGWEDLHLSEVVGSNRVATLDTFSSDALYALYRSTNGAFRGLKLIGGYGATNGNYSLTLATNRIAATVSGVSHTNYSFTVSDWPTDGVKKTGWYRFWNADHETEYYITNFTGSTAKWKLDALIGTASVTTNYSSGNSITNDNQSLPVLAYPKRWTGLSFVNEAHTVHFRGNCTNSPTKITRTDGDVTTGSDFDDLDGDGWREARIYDFGNGDTVEVPAEATLELDGQGYTISANATVTVAIPGSSTTIYVDGVPIAATVANGVMKATIPASVLTGKPQAIGLRKAQKPRRNGGHRLGGL